MNKDTFVLPEPEGLHNHFFDPDLAAALRAWAGRHGHDHRRRRTRFVARGHCQRSSGETINFSSVSTITLTSGELLIDKDLIIAGPGASNLVIQRSSAIGTPDFRIFNVSSGTVTISGLTVSNGRDYIGGGIYNNTADLTLMTALLPTNFATESGGGIFNTSVMIISNCVVRGNSAAGETGDGFGGGVYNASTLIAIHQHDQQQLCHERHGGGFGGGIYNDGFADAHQLSYQRQLR